MDMNWFEDVLVLLEEGNMSRAAARRNITQPAFSRRIRSFEDWLGTEVLARKTNRVELTEALTSNEDEIRALMSRLRELRRKIAYYDPTRTELAIAAQHASVFSTFPDMALRAKTAFPGVRFRLRAGNLSDCVTLFLRGDTSMLLCYEAQNSAPLPFGPDLLRGRWGHDYLIPVIGGVLRYSVRDNRSIPDDTPAIIYPESSYFGEVLRRNARRFGTLEHCRNPVCETAFSSGIREMALKGLGVGWVPFSMVHQELESGELISLVHQFGQEPLDVAIYADRNEEMALSLLKFWAVDV
ncbi:MAG: LysR family transcriptional regulator [Mangrovicoccus sp.]|nr:LysR family transcriptional regulator [Mangrovicoccus sp.]